MLIYPTPEGSAVAHTRNDIIESLRPDQIARFWKKVEKGDGCWTWHGSVARDGRCSWSVNYGGGRFTSLRPYRVMWYLHHGSLEDGSVIDHLCRNRMCVNPEHLAEITQRENAAYTDIARGHPVEKVAKALAASRTDEEVGQWWRRWLDAGATERSRMERAAVAGDVDLLEAIGF